MFLNFEKKWTQFFSRIPFYWKFIGNLEKVQGYLADKKADVQNQKKIGYQKFLDYLDTWFLNENATFNPGFFQYFNSIIFSVNFVTSTNCLERINLALKDTADGGHMPLSRICRVLKKI